ncbi:segregation/condensation protein A [Patescibacteria group bacterium AH-259-L07]|nr:segregation/condensation protein A [Patescibacteria group bacterium AH-259-L07]
MYKVALKQFSGPFDVLLKLIEKEKLDITEVSLSEVADEFLKYLHTLEHVSAQELADFLEVAARLILIKSRLLIPEAIFDEEETDDLLDQLKLYREFAQVSKKVSQLVNGPSYSFVKEKISMSAANNISFDVHVDTAHLEKSFKSVVSTILEQIKLSQKSIKRKVISLREKVNELLILLKKHKKVIFNPLLKGKERVEQAVMFLAVLELMKQKKVQVNQKKLFGEIIISKTSDV